MSLHRDIKAVLAHPAAARTVPFAIFIGFSALLQAAYAITGGYAAWDVRWLGVLRAAVAAVVLALFWRNCGELRAPAGVKLRHWLLAVGFGLTVFAAWIGFDDRSAELNRHDAINPAAGVAIDPFLAGLLLAESVFIVPVIEELFWRSYLLRRLDTGDFAAADPRRTSPRAFAVTALLFASGHRLLFGGLMAGLGYNWLYVRTGNLWVPIAAHAVANVALGIWVLSTGSWHLW